VQHPGWEGTDFSTKKLFLDPWSDVFSADLCADRCILCEEKADGFGEEIGRGNIFRLRDTKHNNIYHIASHAGWSETMRDIVLNHAGLSFEEKNKIESFNQNWRKHQATETRNLERELELQELVKHEKPSKRTDIFVKKARIYSPYNLNSKNKNGDTPLMIAAGQVQVDIVKALIDNGADVTVFLFDCSPYQDLQGPQQDGPRLLEYRLPFFCFALSAT